MRLVRAVLLGLAGLLAACTKGPTSEERLRDELQAQYGVESSPEVGRSPPGRHLSVQLRDTAMMRLTEGEVDQRGQEVARFVLGRYRNASRLDSITVRFIGMASGPLLIARDRQYATREFRR